MRPLLKFFLLTFAVSWIFWAAWFGISKVLTPAHPAVSLLAGAVLLLGVFAPAIVALLLTEHAEGRAATLALLGRIFKWDVGWRWYLFALAYMPVVKLSVALVHRVIAGGWPRFGETPWYLMVAAIAVSTSAQAGEEIGWRGYALPRLFREPWPRTRECHPRNHLGHVAPATFLLFRQRQTGTIVSAVLIASNGVVSCHGLAVLAHWRQFITGNAVARSG